MHEFVVCGTDGRVTGEAPEPRAVDERLRMLDAKADGEGLGFHEHLTLLEHAEGVARTVAEREHDMA